MRESINPWFYELVTQVGPDNVAKAAHQAGIPDDLLPNPSGGIALGDKEVHPVDMASAYATLAAEGVYHEPYIVSRVEAADGEVLYEHEETAGQQVMPQQVARNVIEAMLDVAPHKGFDLPGQQVAAKTGTAQLEGSASDNRDAWFVGFTPSKATAVWVGTDKSEPIRNAQRRPIYGSGLPGEMWHAFMKTATEDDPPEQFSTFVPIGTPPTNDSLSDQESSSSDEDDDDDENSDSDEDRDDDSSRSSDDDRSSSSDRNSRSNDVSGDDNDNGRGNGNGNGGSRDQPTSDTQDSDSAGSTGSSPRGQSDSGSVG
jgi:membrane peptidoglycan carboxypeptidase